MVTVFTSSCGFNLKPSVTLKGKTVQYWVASNCDGKIIAGFDFCPVVKEWIIMHVGNVNFTKGFVNKIWERLAELDSIAATAR